MADYWQHSVQPHPVLSWQQHQHQHPHQQQHQHQPTTAPTVSTLSPHEHALLVGLPPTVWARNMHGVVNAESRGRVMATLQRDKGMHVLDAEELARRVEAEQLLYHRCVCPQVCPSVLPMWLCICKCVCACVCMFVCVYECISVWMSVCLFVCECIWLDGWMDVYVCGVKHTNATMKMAVASLLQSTRECRQAAPLPGQVPVHHPRDGSPVWGKGIIADPWAGGWGLIHILSLADPPQEVP